MQIITPSATPRKRVVKKATKNIQRSDGCAFARKMTSWNSTALTTENITVDEIITIGIYCSKGTIKYTDKSTKQPVKKPDS